MPIGMVYGILRLINFAHGDILMIGAYFVFFGTFAFGWPWGVAAVVAVLGASVLGVLVERIAYRPLRDAPRISALISAIAVSFFIESLAVVVFTGQPRPVLQPEWLVAEWQLGGVRILPLTAFVPAMTIVLVAVLLYVVYRTKPGLAMVFKGTDHRPKGQVARDVEALGGYLNAATSFDKTWFMLLCVLERFFCPVN